MPVYDSTIFCPKRSFNYDVIRENFRSRNIYNPTSKYSTLRTLLTRCSCFRWLIADWSDHEQQKVARLSPWFRWVWLDSVSRHVIVIICERIPLSISRIFGQWLDARASPLVAAQPRSILRRFKCLWRGHWGFKKICLQEMKKLKNREERERGGQLSS